MKSPHRSLGAALAVAVAFAAAAPGPAGAEELSGEEKANTLYAIGTLMARQLKPLDLSAEELEQIQRGIRDAASGGKLAVKADDYREQINSFTQTRNRAASAREATEAQKFIDVAAAEKGAITTPSGLVYLEREAGSGASPGPEDTVEVHYHGTLRDGSVFDSSVDKGSTVQFPLNRVIQCWTEGLQRMKPGGKSRLVCPAKIAYGDRGAPPAIPGGAALAFEVELVAVHANAK